MLHFLSISSQHGLLTLIVSDITGISAWQAICLVHAHIRTEKNSNISQFYYKIAKKKSNSKAAIAAASKLLKIVYRIMKEKRVYKMIMMLTTSLITNIIVKLAGILCSLDVYTRISLFDFFQSDNLRAYTLLQELPEHPCFNIFFWKMCTRKYLAVFYLLGGV
jgi:hypothetical protein